MLLDAAWQSGAWDVERVEQRGCNVIGASAAETLACRQAFGDYGKDMARDPLLLDDKTDRDGLMQLAARRGYVRWLFRPSRAACGRTPNEPDDTLDIDGGRQPPCPVSRPGPADPTGAAARFIALVRSIASCCRAETICYICRIVRPLEAPDGRLYFAFRQTLARLHGGASRTPDPQPDSFIGDPLIAQEMEMQVRPLYDRVIVKRIATQRTTASAS